MPGLHIAFNSSSTLSLQAAIASSASAKTPPAHGPISLRIRLVPLRSSHAYLLATLPNRAESGIALSFLTAEYFDKRIRDQSKARIPRCTLPLADTSSNQR